jgi:hypothetical protein
VVLCAGGLGFEGFVVLGRRSQGLRIFQFLYFFSSFWNQVGFSGSVCWGFGVRGVCGVRASQSGSAHLLFLYFFGSF